MLDFRYRKNTCYDPFDYESINQVGFWVIEEKKLSELDIDENVRML